MACARYCITNSNIPATYLCTICRGFSNTGLWCPFAHAWQEKEEALTGKKVHQKDNETKA